MRMRKHNISKISIEVDFGSDFQEETNMDTLKMMLSVWEGNCTMKHKGNKVSISYS